jgi:hypothetical protein
LLQLDTRPDTKPVVFITSARPSCKGRWRDGRVDDEVLCLCLA